MNVWCMVLLLSGTVCFFIRQTHTICLMFFCSVSILMCCPPLHGKQRGTLHISKKIVRNRFKRNGYLLFKVAFQINKQLCLRWLSTRVFEPVQFCESRITRATWEQTGTKKSPTFHIFRAKKMAQTFVWRRLVFLITELYMRYHIS